MLDELVLVDLDSLLGWVARSRIGMGGDGMGDARE